MACCTPKTGSASARVGFSRSGRNDLYIGSLCSMSVLQFVGCTTLARMPRGASSAASVVDVLRQQPLRVQVGRAAGIIAGIVVLGDVHQRRGGAGGDDRRALAQVRQRDLDGVDRADQVGVDDVDPGLQRRLALHAAMPACATTMSRWPNSARPRSSASRSWPASRTSACAVTMPPAGLLDELGGLLEILRASPSGSRPSRSPGTDVDRDDVRALLGQPDRVAAALPARGAGDECDFPLNASHLSMSFRFRCCDRR